MTPIEELTAAILAENTVFTPKITVPKKQILELIIARYK